MAKSAFGTKAVERGTRYRTGVRTLQVSDDVIPIAALKVHLSEVVRSLEHRGRPVIVTLNGKAAAVLVSPSDYDRLSYHLYAVSKIQRGLADAAQGRTISHAEVGRRIARRYGAMSKTRRCRPRTK